MLATLIDAPFDGKDWLFEDKYDGFRMVATIEGGEAYVRSDQARHQAPHDRWLRAFLYARA